MKDLLTDLYNKVVSFFQPDKEIASKEIASNRLKLVLMQDRTNLDANTLEKLREELMKVISKYVEIDTDEFGVNLEGVGDSIALMLNIPVIRAKTPEEIQQAIDAEKEVSNEEEIISDSETTEDFGLDNNETSENTDNIEQPKDSAEEISEESSPIENLSD